MVECDVEARKLLFLRFKLFGLYFNFKEISNKVRIKIVDSENESQIIFRAQCGINPTLTQLCSCSVAQQFYMHQI